MEAYLFQRQIMEADSFLRADCFSHRILTKCPYNSTATSLNAHMDHQLHHNNQQQRLTQTIRPSPGLLMPLP
jgi:uncharacterized protein VirK/YbjX